MDITYRPAKPEDLAEAERVVQQSGNALRPPWQAALAGATSDRLSGILPVARFLRVLGRGRRRHDRWLRLQLDDREVHCHKESEALSRFQAEWAEMQGAKYPGTSFQFHRELRGPYVTPDEFHQHDLERARRYKRRR
jgi:hypothetical protein